MRQSPAWLIRETIDGTKQRSDLLLSIRHRCRNKSLRKHITYRTKETAMLLKMYKDMLRQYRRLQSELSP